MNSIIEIINSKLCLRDFTHQLPNYKLDLFTTGLSKPYIDSETVVKKTIFNIDTIDDKYITLSSNPSISYEIVSDLLTLTNISEIGTLEDKSITIRGNIYKRNNLYKISLVIYTPITIRDFNIFISPDLPSIYSVDLTEGYNNVSFLFKASSNIASSNHIITLTNPYWVDSEQVENISFKSLKVEENLYQIFMHNYVKFKEGELGIATDDDNVEFDITMNGELTVKAVDEDNYSINEKGELIYNL